jgi:hypothetical protein
MWKGLNIFIYLILLEKCILTSNFLLSGEKQLMLIPSVAFPSHSNDWIVYIQG